jgi:hypothetical protein
MVYGLRFIVYGLLLHEFVGLWAYGFMYLWFMVYGLRVMVYGIWFMVDGLWFMVDGLWFMYDVYG